MDYKRYIELTQTDPQKAKLYKNSFIPDRLFKYISLCGDSSKDEKRFRSLQKGELHLGTYSDYNDPFEGTYLLIDEVNLSAHGWKEGMVSDIYHSLVNGFKICSLAETTEQNMPMWAYYANNHKGFCVEYSFTDKQKDYIFPVSYENERHEATSQLSNLIYDEIHVAMNYLGDDVGKKVDMIKPESARTNVIVFLTIAAKHKSWSHEKEYRIITSDNHDSFPAIPSRIYAGKDCDSASIERLTEITKEYQNTGFPVELYQMKFDPNNKHFELDEKRIV
nr:DUF2971 domain-containing protein [uncultured Butyrivibrio sp.]